MKVFKFFKQNNDERRNTSSNTVDTVTYERVLQRIAERDTDISALKSKVAALQIDVEHLRGKILARLRGITEKEPETEKDLSEGYVPFG